MACLSISIAGDLGYILMDTVHSRVDPIVVMYAGRPGFGPHTGVTEYQRDKVEFKTICTNKKYVYSFCFGNIYPALIYAGFPYISKTESTQKPSLLLLMRYLKSRDKKGETTASFSFTAVPTTDITRDGKEICVATFGIQVREQQTFEQFNTILYDNRTSAQKSNDRVYKLIRDANAEMKLNPGQLLEIIKKSAALMEDLPFLRDLQKLK